MLKSNLVSPKGRTALEVKRFLERVSRLLKEDINLVKDSFLNSPFYNHLGLEIIQFQDNNVKIKLAVKENLLNANGTLHGGVLASMLDFIQGMLLRSVTKTKCVTISLNTHFLASVTEGDVFAEAKILQLGYKIATLEGQITDSGNKLLAKGIGTFKILRES
ncbi:PaaI family thioesterase [Peribacillus glennii]|uniref:PaaI family thioesterase n=1 Tax=Peribacillus glennii TaxID=2303991 RepID=UPI001F4022BA|nr:PaaI family thioesterase [Peribacillus glennii]